MPPTTTVAGWATIIGLSLIIYYIYFRKPIAKGHQPLTSKLPPKTTEKRKEPKKLRKGRKDEGQSSGEQEKRLNETGLNKEQKIENYTPAGKDIDRNDEEVDNREFARQLSSAKAGTLMPSKSQDGARQRSIKQSRAQEKPPVETSSDNGTAGGDADDDRSSANSPELGATTMTIPVGNGDFSDMLEARPSGPSVLRITPATAPTLSKKGKPAPAFEPAETKKQRQNRKKAEGKKLAREEEEKERKTLLEKQRRTAREAEGRAAKDGTTFMAAKAPSSSAWVSPPAAMNRNSSAEKTKVDLLDTYDQSSSKAAAPHADTLYSESELAGSDWQKLASNLPSEEEQMRRAMEDSDNWKTVQGKEKRIRKKTQPTLPAKLEDKQSSTDEQSEYGVPPLIAPTGAGQKWKMTLVSEKSDGELEERETEVQDSEWEVA